MVDSDITPIREVVDKKPVEKCAAFLQEVQSAQVYSTRPVLTSANYESGYLDFENDNAVAEKKVKLLKTMKCECVGYAVGEAAASYYEPGYTAGHLTGVKKTLDEEAFNKKLSSKYQDFPQIPTIGPAAAGFFDRVDRNEDGRMSNGEINTALDGDKLNEKEKSVLETIKKNKNSIDNDRDGVSMSDLKEFDAKVIQYNKELAMSRKFSPDLAELARVLHQRGKLVDDDHNGRFSYEELTNFYVQCKKEFLCDQSVDGKRHLAALNWGMANFDRYAITAGSWGRGQISMDNLQRQILREMDREAPGEMRQYFLSPSDRWRVERYQNTL